MRKCYLKPIGWVDVKVGNYDFIRRKDGKPLDFSWCEERLIHGPESISVCSQCNTCTHVSEHLVDGLREKYEERGKVKTDKELMIEAHRLQRYKSYCPRWREEMGEMRPRNVCDHGLPCPFYEPQESVETDK